MPQSNTDALLENNKRYASGQQLHKSGYPGNQGIQPAKRVAIVACMDARLDVEDMLGLQTGEAHVIRNAGGVITEDAIRSLIISHHLLNTNEIILIHHTRCGMLAFPDELLKAGLEGDPGARQALSQATGRTFESCGSKRDGTGAVPCLPGPGRTARRPNHRPEPPATHLGRQALDVEIAESPLAADVGAGRGIGARLHLRRR